MEFNSDYWDCGGCKPIPGTSQPYCPGEEDCGYAHITADGAMVYENWVNPPKPLRFWNCVFDFANKRVASGSLGGILWRHLKSYSYDRCYDIFWNE